jgi:hypothetical protein
LRNGVEKIYSHITGAFFAKHPNAKGRRKQWLLQLSEYFFRDSIKDNKKLKKIISRH